VIICSKTQLTLMRWRFFCGTNVQATRSSISRAFASKGWSKGTARVEARARNLEFRDEYSHFVSDFYSYHLVYIDESECEKTIGFRRTGRSHLVMTPVQVSRFYRDQRYHILPIYAQDGTVFYRVFRGSTDTSVFEDFIEQILWELAGAETYSGSL